MDRLYTGGNKTNARDKTKTKHRKEINTLTSRKRSLNTNGIK